MSEITSLTIGTVVLTLTFLFALWQIRREKLAASQRRQSEQMVEKSRAQLTTRESYLVERVPVAQSTSEYIGTAYR